MYIINDIDAVIEGVEAKQDSTVDIEDKNEELDAVPIWEISRRRSRHSRQTAAQARSQGKRRQLRRLWGRSR